MESSPVDSLAIKATTDPLGVVWLLERDGLPFSTGVQADKFQIGKLPRNTCVRVPGLHRNAGLLLRLDDELMPLAVPLQVCTPMLTDRRLHWDTAFLLYMARTIEGVPASVGGWHDFSEADRSHCQFVESLGSEEAPTGLLSSHPAWRGLSFVEGLSTESACRLLGELFDPRWYIDSVQPNRHNKMRQFLGLVPGSRSTSARSRRRDLVISCWKTSDPPPPKDLGPGSFLWRIWHARGGGEKGDMAASRAFIAFLQQVWLSALCRGWQSQRLFVASDFFSNSFTAEQFAMHMKSK